ncbi:GDSL-type esterase/lipase family protein [Algoriphagus sp. CAU 1675]|uniref:GDSL-type esterase/lipase family protein n=1 Tax=Algoriphagus sp. CAU 1675 TaxID=3032597 RepID=UPI0023DAC68C|nr:GDSL-type esterase/lipase family protein [Algoriphagus sp. CAU 1675]MDF2157332.1 GDSL-type esterase/lipase family protein [Algoriphagus sp. CAU 1675]
MKNPKILLLLLFFLILAGRNYAQQIPFQEEVNQLTAQIDKKGWSKGSIVFTGSSSIRMWKNIQEEFADVPIINTGFGGSQASDLLTHLESLVNRYDPQAVFIYEGDNDINAGKSTEEIIHDLDQILHKLNEHKEGISIYFIGAKPSPSRWNLKDSYEQFNKALESYAEGMINSQYIDVWSPMLDPTGNPRPELFLEDMLHMKPEGYEIWKKQLDPHIKFLKEMIYQ